MKRIPLRREHLLLFFHLLAILPFLLAPRPALCDAVNTPFPREDANPAFHDHGTLQQAALYSGYRFITPGGSTASAPYLQSSSGIIAGFSAGIAGETLKLNADAQFLHTDDYSSELFLDYSGLYRLTLESSALWHNLAHIPPVAAAGVNAIDLNSGARYGTRAITTRAKNRFKLGTSPVHIELDYWQLARSGSDGLRFADVAPDVQTSATYNRSRPIDSITREGTIGIDAHLGPVNAAYVFLIRDFSNQADDLRDRFSGYDGLAAAVQAHNVVNGNRLTSHTFKLYSDLSGGLTGAAQYVLTQREASTGRGDVRLSQAPSETTHAVAGDLAYTPFKELSLALAYRRLQVERDSPATLYSPFSVLPANPSPLYTGTSGQLLVRPAISTVRDTMTLSLGYHPQLRAALRFEYRAERETRSDLPDVQTPAQPTATRGDSRQSHTGKVSFTWKPVNATRFNAAYSYSATDNPAYGSSYSQRHNGQATVSYTASGRWGITAGFQGRAEHGERSVSPVVLPRESMTLSANGSAWFTPLERVTLSANYSYLRSAVDQASLFESHVPDETVRVSGAYRSSAQMYSLDAVVALARYVDLSLAFQQTFADIRYSAIDQINDPLFSSGGIGDQSRLASTDTLLTARADWHISHHLGCAIGYTFRNFASGERIYDGSVHETLLTLSGRW